MAIVRRRPRVALRRKRQYRKRYGARKMTMYRRPRPAVLSIKRKFWFGLWQPNTTTVAGYWRQMYLALNQIPNYTELTVLFDEFKISAIKYTLMPNYTAADANQVYTGSNILNKPQMAICYDKYTTVTPSGGYSSATWNSFSEQGQVKLVKDPLSPVHIYISRPTITKWEASQGSPSTSLKTAPFLNCSNFTTINHYGPQVFINDPNFTGNNLGPYSWDIYVTVYMQFRNQR